MLKFKIRAPKDMEKEFPEVKVSLEYRTINAGSENETKKYMLVVRNIVNTIYVGSIEKPHLKMRKVDEKANKN